MYRQMEGVSPGEGSARRRRLVGGRHGCFEAAAELNSPRKMSKMHVKMGGVEGADLTPAASATPRQY
jgi:hypothetical protein